MPSRRAAVRDPPAQGRDSCPGGQTSRAGVRSCALGGQHGDGCGGGMRRTHIPEKRFDMVW
jgi:hypothetical protein